MTQSLAKRPVTAASSLPQLASLPAELPPALTETRAAEGFRNEMWAARALRPGESVAIQQAVVAFEARLTPASDIQALYHVGRLLAHWGHQRRGNGDNDTVLDDFADDLAPYSEAHIAEACRTWRRTQKFRPMVADLVGLIETLQHRERELARRARVLLGLELPRHWEKQPPPPAKAPPLSATRRAALLRKIDSRSPLAATLRAIIQKAGEPEEAKP